MLYLMTTDYEIFYKNNQHGLGEPTKEFVTFFHNYAGNPGRVLDIGCGQGRDALFIARLGHRVTALDLSPTGISQLETDAENEGLDIHGVVTDIRHYQWKGKYEVIVIDRTLHMLTALERTDVLAKALKATAAGSHVLIADEPSNIAALRAVFENSRWKWTVTLERKGFLFMARCGKTHTHLSD